MEESRTPRDNSLKVSCSMSEGDILRVSTLFPDDSKEEYFQDRDKSG